MARFRGEKKIEEFVATRATMKKFDLDSELNSLRVPERGPDFWNAFPERVLAELRSATPVSLARRRAGPGVVWNVGLALACLMVVFCLGGTQTGRAAFSSLLKDEREWRQSIRKIPSHARAFMQDEHGLDKLIEDPV